MTILSWRARNPKGEELDPLVYLEFDATLLEEFTRSADATTFPVESGGVLSDHVQPKQRALTVEVFVSDTPIQGYADQTLPDGAVRANTTPAGVEAPKDLTPYLKIHKEPVYGLAGQRVIQGNLQRVPSTRTASVLQFNGEVTRVVDIFVVLADLVEKRQPLKVLFMDNLEFDNMFITNLRAPVAAGNGSGITFTMDMIQLEVADVQRSKAAKKKKRTPARKAHKEEQLNGQMSVEPPGVASDSLTTNQSGYLPTAQQEIFTYPFEGFTPGLGA